MHILTKTLWIVTFMLFITETATIVKHISYNKKNEIKEKTISNITLRDNRNIVKIVKIDLRKIFIWESIIFPLCVIIISFIIMLLMFIVIRFRCPHLLELDNLHVPDRSNSYRRQSDNRSQSDQSRIHQPNHYQAVYTKSNKSIKDDESTEENY